MILLTGRYDMKLLASDFDGTLFFHQENPSIRKNDIQTILHFQRQGNLFGICTGLDLEGIIEPVEDQITFDFYILHSGSLILDRNYNIIYQKRISIQDVKKVLWHYKEVESAIFHDNKIYLYRHSRGWKKDSFHFIHHFDEIKEKFIQSFSFHLETEKEARNIADEINNMNLNIQAFQNKTDVDCIAKNNSKGYAIKIIQQYFHLNEDDVSCIGDSYNDLSMLEASKNSFTFYDSPVTVKRKAKYLVHGVDECIALLMQK